MNSTFKKPALTEYNIHPILKERFSPRTFSDKIPDKNILENLFEAVRWAPSSSNDQPWNLIVGIKGTLTYQKIFSSLVDFNQKWAHLAPVLIVISGEKKSKKTGKLNSAYQYDCGQAAAHLTFQAMHEGLYAHQMGGFSKESIIMDFNLKDDFDPMIVIALGFLGTPDLLDNNFRKMELATRTRKLHSDFVRYE